MALFINETEIIGVIIGQAASTTFGSMFLALLSIYLILIALALMFGIKMEYTMILAFPLMLAYMSRYSEFLSIGAATLIYLSLILTKNFIIK